MHTSCMCIYTMATKQALPCCIYHPAVHRFVSQELDLPVSHRTIHALTQYEGIAVLLYRWRHHHSCTGVHHNVCPSGARTQVYCGSFWCDPCMNILLGAWLLHHTDRQRLNLTLTPQLQPKASPNNKHMTYAYWYPKAMLYKTTNHYNSFYFCYVIAH